MENKKREEFYVEGIGKIPSIEKMAEKSGRSIKYVLMQRGKGATDKQIYNGELSDFICHGVVYNNANSFIRENNLTQTRNDIFYKLQKGASLEEIVEFERTGKQPDYYIKKTREGRKVVIEGVKYNSIQAAYHAYENDPRVTADYTNIKQRIVAYGWDDEKAFFTKKREYNPIQ